MIYFDNAATSRYKPFCVIKELVAGTIRSANPGRSGHLDAVNAALKIEKCREVISRRLGGGKVVFTKNCTEALNLAILGSGLTGHVVTTVYEHNSVLRPLNFLERKKDVTISYVKPILGGKVPVSGILNAVKRDTKMIIINHSSNVNGATQNIEAISEYASKNHILTLIDASQSLGHTEADFSFCDLVACSGHKGLHSPQGTGFLYFKENATPSPILFGGTGTDSLSTEQPTSVPEGLEAGTLNAAGIAALRAGAEWSFKNQKKHILKTERLSKLIIEGLKECSGIRLYYSENGIILFNVKNIPSGEVADTLSGNYGIAVRAGLHCAPLAHRHLGTYETGAVRVSVGYNNSEDDVEALLRALEEIIEKRKDL